LTETGTQTMKSKQDYLPEEIRNSPDVKIYGKIWGLLHNRNRMFSCVIVGKPGRGKSWLSIAMAEMLDRTKLSGTRFKQEHITFGEKEFSEVIRKKHKPGTFIIVDDAGISLYSREALKKEVIALSKIFQTVRYKNLGIILTLPSWAMLDKNIRRLTDAYIEVLDPDLSSKESIYKFQWVEASPLGDTIYRKYPKETKITITMNDIEYKKKYRKVEFRLPRASYLLLQRYEQRKEDYMGKLYTTFYREIHGGKKTHLDQKIEEIYKNKRKYYEEVKGITVISSLLILADPNSGVNNDAVANKVARFLNARMKKERREADATRAVK